MGPWWETDPVSVVGTVVEVGVAAAYVAGVVTLRRGGARWPRFRLPCFLSGVLLIALVLQSGLAAYDETYWFHVTQHTLLMSVAAPLLALGAPVTLALRGLPRRWARHLASVMRGRAATALGGPPAAWHAPVDYYGLMFIYLLTPLYALGQRSEPVHVAAHVVFLTCGLLFWTPVVGADRSRWRPDPAARTRLVALGLPISVALGAATRTWAPLVTGCLAALLGLALVGWLNRDLATRTAHRRMRATRVAAAPAAP